MVNRLCNVSVVCFLISALSSSSLLSGIGSFIPNESSTISYPYNNSDTSSIFLTQLAFASEGDGEGNKKIDTKENNKKSDDSQQIEGSQQSDKKADKKDTNPPQQPPPPPSPDSSAPIIPDTSDTSPPPPPPPSPDSSAPIIPGLAAPLSPTSPPPIPIDCAKTPDDPSCPTAQVQKQLQAMPLTNPAPGSQEYCKYPNTGASVCTPGTPDYCKVHVGESNAACVERPITDAQKQAARELCKNHPEQPACIPGTFEHRFFCEDFQDAGVEECKDVKTHPKGPDCSDKGNPDDPRCQPTPPPPVSEPGTPEFCAEPGNKAHPSCTPGLAPAPRSPPPLTSQPVTCDPTVQVCTPPKPDSSAPMAPGLAASPKPPTTTESPCQSNRFDPKCGLYDCKKPGPGGGCSPIEGEIPKVDCILHPDDSTCKTQVCKVLPDNPGCNSASPTPKPDSAAPITPGLAPTSPTPPPNPDSAAPITPGLAPTSPPTSQPVTCDPTAQVCPALDGSQLLPFASPVGALEFTPPPGKVLCDGKAYPNNSDCPPGSYYHATSCLVHNSVNNRDYCAELIAQYSPYFKCVTGEVDERFTNKDETSLKLYCENLPSHNSPNQPEQPPTGNQPPGGQPQTPTPTPVGGGQQPPLNTQPERQPQIPQPNTPGEQLPQQPPEGEQTPEPNPITTPGERETPNDEPRVDEPPEDQPPECPTMSAGTFGLPSNNLKTSEYGVTRVYLKDKSVHTVPPRTDPTSIYPRDQIVTVRTHTGIDYSSRDPAGKVANEPFKAGVSGTVHIVPGSKYNTVNVVLSDGSTIQYMHASKINVSEGQQINPDTDLGLTGSTGANAVHLHIQAKDPQGNPINPEDLINKYNRQSNHGCQ